MRKLPNLDTFALDRIRFGGGGLLKSHALRFLWVLRRAECSKSIIWKIALQQMRNKYGLELFPGSIGPGLYLGHARNITVNPRAVLGCNVNLAKGVTIGQENRGKRKGCPTIGDCVWIGANATVVGNITIGDDVLIAPNSYVNMDVPSHSIVIGNPGRIISRDRAIEGYINNTI